jgi:hypothetical protein
VLLFVYWSPVRCRLYAAANGQRHGWLIFALPPLEAAFRDSEKNDHHELFLMCEDLATTLQDLKSKHVTVSEVRGTTLR